MVYSVLLLILLAEHVADCMLSVATGNVL